MRFNGKMALKVFALAVLVIITFGAPLAVIIHNVIAK